MSQETLSESEHSRMAPCEGTKWRCCLGPEVSGTTGATPGDAQETMGYQGHTGTARHVPSLQPLNFPVCEKGIPCLVPLTHFRVCTVGRQFIK